MKSRRARRPSLLPTKPYKAAPEGQRHFEREPLGQVLERVSRYHDVKFVFTDSALRDLRVSGAFRLSDLTLLLRTLSAALPIKSRYLDTGQIEISSTER
jgi:transmembrane sensor